MTLARGIGSLAMRVSARSARKYTVGTPCRPIVRKKGVLGTSLVHFGLEKLTVSMD